MARRKPSDSLSQELEIARRGAIECCEAAKDFWDTVLAHEGESEPPNYSKCTARLYRALRFAWEPICRCWPALVTRRIREFELRRVGIATPDDAWMRAEETFWLAVTFGHRKAAAKKAWTEWAETFSTECRKESYAPMEGISWATIRDFYSSPDAHGLYGSLALNQDRAAAALEQSVPDAPMGASSNVPAKPEPYRLAKPLPENVRGLRFLEQRLVTYISAIADDQARRKEQRFYLGAMGQTLHPSTGGPQFSELRSAEFLIPEPKNSPVPPPEAAAHIDGFDLMLRSELLYRARNNFFVAIAEMAKLAPGQEHPDRESVRATFSNAEREFAQAQSLVYAAYTTLRLQVHGMLANLDGPKKGNLSKKTTPKKRGDWANKEPPPQGSKWQQNGPVEGSLKELAARIGKKDGRAIRGRYENGTLWVMFISAKQYKIWFPDSTEYAKCRFGR